MDGASTDRYDTDLPLLYVSLISEVSGCRFLLGVQHAVALGRETQHIVGRRLCQAGYRFELMSCQM